MKKYLPLLLVVLLMCAAYFSGLTDHLSLANLKAQQNSFANFYAQHPILTPFIFVTAYITIVALSLPIASLITFLGGALFGLIFGTILVAIGATTGACIIFLVARSTLGEPLRAKTKNSPRAQKLEAEMAENGFNYLLFLRLVPLFPFFLINIVPALVNMRLTPYALATFLGILPGTAIYVNIGQNLANITTLKGLLTPQLLSAFLLLGLFALVPTIVKKLKKKA